MRIIIFILGVFVHFSCFSQVSNDDCFNASPLGTLPAPANCGNGPNNDGQGDPVTFTNLTNVGAQTENPYTTLINCQGSGQDMASPATDVWYSFVPSGLSLDITINGLINDPNVALWAGNCGNLIGAGCDIGSGGSLTTTIDQLNPGDTYYLQISGGDLNDEGTFDLTLQNNVDCNACLLASTMTVDPLPVNGTYQPGTVVTFCFTVDEWNQTNTNWFQGVVPIMGSSWINLTPISSPPTCDSGPGIWDWFTGVTTPLGNSNGFFFDGAIAGFNTIPDGDPTNNFGDNCQGTGLDWEFCWQATVENCPPGQTGDDLSVNIETYGDGETGNWSDVGCNFDPVFLFSASLACCASPLVSSGDVSCQGLSDGIVTAEAQTTANPWDFEWTDDSGNVISTSNNSNSATNEVLNLAAGIYTVTVTDANGCFSSSSITITEPPIVTPIFNQIADICNGGSFSLPNISDNSVSGNWSPVNNSSSTTTYTFTPDAGECALTETMTVVVNQSSTGTDTQSACVSYLWIDGNTYSTNNNTATLNIVGGASNGCDSLVTLDLTINNTVVGTDIQTACGSYLWIDGVNYTSSSNAATFNIVGGASNGCDSLVTLDLTINNTVVGVDIQTACGSYLWIDGVNYTSSNNAATFNIVGGAENGCDSLVTLDLTINNLTTGTDTQAACDTYTWIDGNIYTASNNSATWLLSNAAGCDSIVTLDLTITIPTTGTDTQASCDNYTWINGVTYIASNNSATFLLTNAVGCDSLVTLDLTIANSLTGTDTQTACDTYTWIDGNTYTTSNNSAAFTLTASGGCDSLVTLDLTISNSSTGIDFQTACDSYTWVDGNTYTTSNNSATFLLTNTAGCDSTVTLDLIINNSVTGTDTQTACDSYLWIDGNTYVVSNNSASFNITGGGVNGCDSLVSLDLTINNTPSYTMSGTDPDICNASNGSITISGLNAGALYTISYDSLSTPSQVSNFTADTFGEYLILGLGAGLYSSFSIIHNGCEFTSPDLMDLNNPGAPSINFQLDSTVCDTYTLLDISGTNLSGNESYYTQSNAEGTPLLSGDMISSTQTIYIYDILGTCSDESSFTVTVTNTPSIINPGPQESCESFILPLSIQGNNLSGNQNYYNDSQSNGGSPINDAILSSQTVYVYDENGTCSNEVSFDITINELPMLLSFTGEGIYCDGDLIDDLLVEVSGAPDYTLDYTLNGIPLNISSSSSPLNLGNTSGAYVITSLSDNACDIILNNVQTVIVNPIPVAPDVSEDVLYCANMIPEQVLASGSSGEYTWYSDPAISQIISFGESIIPNVVLGSMTYYVTANDSDCEGLPASVTITFEECNIIIPTAFTPDNDMVNDIWELENIDNIYPNNKVFIYNRWGNQIFESEKGAYSQRPWDGRFNGNALPVASYYYIVVFNDGVTDQSIGIVSILTVSYTHLTLPTIYSV